MDRQIHVTQSFAPDISTFESFTDTIIKSRIFTNNGPLCRKLERELSVYLGADYLSLCSNGTRGLEIALHAVQAAGKTIITTPFSYVATVSAALWIGCRILFADIDEKTLAIDPKCVAALMNEDVAAIIPVNIYGHPCDAQAIRDIAGPKPVIYDAAQAFGAVQNGKSLFLGGDLAVGSFHATKVFHTFEGGCIISRSREMHEKINLLRAFGHSGDSHFCLGTNAKISEIHAACGLAMLDRAKENIRLRGEKSRLYDEILSFSHFRKPVLPAAFQSNNGYYPIVFDSENMLLKVMEKLAEIQVFPRRYFYPSLNTLPYLKYQSCPVSESIAKCALCLPLFAELPERKLEQIADIVNRICRNA